MNNVLKISQHPTKTLIWWYSRRSEIEFSPPYQRKGRLWSATDKAYLIDSVINGFDVPKLYLADFQYGQSPLNETKKSYAIIDGKQRLEAIFDFFDNKITLNGDFEYRKDPGLRLGGLSLKDLRRNYPSVAEDFENESLDIMSVVAQNQEDVHEIFVRLNKSKPLTGAEVRNAVVGPVPDLIRVLASHNFFLENIKFSVKRATDLNAAAKILLFEYRNKLSATKKTDLDSFAKEDVNKERLELASRRALDTLNLMSEVFIPRDDLLSSSGIIPVYYWFIRDLFPEHGEHVREFLVRFETARKNNRELQKLKDESAVDAELARYDTLNRSTNDATSHVERVNILMRRYNDWKQSRQNSFSFNR